MTYFLSLADIRFSWFGKRSWSAVSYDQKIMTLVTLIGFRRRPINQKGSPLTKDSENAPISSEWGTLNRMPDLSGSLYSM